MLKFIFKNFKLIIYFQQRKFFYESLQSRSLIKLSGKDCKLYLQGLITNDIYALENSHRSIYSLFLNAKGRILFDVILYGDNKTEDLFIECDSRVVDLITKHLNMYKLRKKVDINHIQNAGIFSIMPENETENLEILKPLHIDNDKLIYFGSDPRIKSWLLRCIGLDNSVQSILSPFKPSPPHFYTEYRLAHGICEGVDEIAIDSALPLEYNADIANGICFNKGCYIGQELTARTHHTGVVRKRIMPIQFDKSFYHRLNSLINKDKTIIELRDKQNGKIVGQIRTVDESGRGLAIIRLSSLQFHQKSANGTRLFVPVVMDIVDCPIAISAPLWWPDNVVLPNA